MNKEFNKVELNVLNNIKQYRYISIICMLLFSIGTMFAIYFLLFPLSTYESRHINVIRLNSMVTMLCLSFFMYTCVRVIEKLQFNYKTELGLTGEDDTV